MLELPQELILSLKEVKGFDEKAFIQVHHKNESVAAIRINPQKITTQNIDKDFKPIAWSPYGYWLSERPVFTLDPAFHGGAYYVQEAASQFLWEVLHQVFPENSSAKVLDLCAAPGGKTTLLSSYFANGLVVANEVIKSRCAILEENVTKWGNKNIVVTNNDPKDFQRLGGFFDALVIDAPCSGSGLFRRDNNAISEWSPENVILCSQRQQRILHDSFSVLKENGVLIYSTCSYSTEENETIVDYILQQFDVESIRLSVPSEWNITEVQSTKKEGYGYRFFSNKTQTEGLFIAAFVKKNATTFVAEMNAGKLPLISQKEKEEIQKWISSTDEFSFIKINEKCIAIDKNFEEEINTIKQNLYIKQAGFEVGEFKKKGLVPAHAFALSGFVNETICAIELDKKQALHFLRKEDFNISESVTGWALAKFENIPIGWMKILPNRINNYYPTEWRILMK